MPASERGSVKHAVVELMSRCSRGYIPASKPRLKSSNMCQFIKPVQPVYKTCDSTTLESDSVCTNIKTTLSHPILWFPSLWQIIARLVDGSKFHSFKGKYGPTLCTGFARINGYLYHLGWFTQWICTCMYIDYFSLIWKSPCGLASALM